MFAMPALVFPALTLTALTLTALTSSAQAAKVPAIINVGMGPTIGTVMSPSAQGPAPLSVGVALRAEGWVSGKTLRSKKVMKRVPRKYRGMVRNMDDMHVVPMPVWLVPDTVFVASVKPEAPTMRGVGWTPVSVYLMHKVKPMHTSVALSPRLGWVQYAQPQADPLNMGWFGVDLNPEVQSRMKRKVGVAAGGNAAVGYATQPIDAAGQRPWLWLDGYLRLQLRFDYSADI